jgi:hypothetical protein
LIIASVAILAVALRQYISSRKRSLGGLSDLTLAGTSDAWSMPALPSAAAAIRRDKTV